MPSVSNSSIVSTSASLSATSIDCSFILRPAYAFWTTKPDNPPIGTVYITVDQNNNSTQTSKTCDRSLLSKYAVTSSVVNPDSPGPYIYGGALGGSFDEQCNFVASWPGPPGTATFSDINQFYFFLPNIVQLAGTLPPITGIPGIVSGTISPATDFYTDKIVRVTRTFTLGDGSTRTSVLNDLPSFANYFTDAGVKSVVKQCSGLDLETVPNVLTAVNFLTRTAVISATATKTSVPPTSTSSLVPGSNPHPPGPSETSSPPPETPNRQPETPTSSTSAFDSQPSPVVPPVSPPKPPQVIGSSSLDIGNLVSIIQSLSAAPAQPPQIDQTPTPEPPPILTQASTQVVVPTRTLEQGTNVPQPSSANAIGAIVLGSQTLSHGSTITVDGHVVSIPSTTADSSGGDGLSQDQVPTGPTPSSNPVVVVDGSTIPVTALNTALPNIPVQVQGTSSDQQESLGDFIADGLGGIGGNNHASGVNSAQGVATGSRPTGTAGTTQGPAGTISKTNGTVVGFTGATSRLQLGSRWLLWTHLLVIAAMVLHLHL
ncbi:hypothetical protein C1H76_0332 [Elsinoe australis]|uniref:Uncharacterized protein n=1 Tax=Elsinoe australis TaxID=40998 RepID=A0A4U7BBN1_9PEZI|nr:hypothetical protein C1H76_0332 [Elsinoe australis]